MSKQPTGKTEISTARPVVAPTEPRSLGGLLLRPATAADADELADFNVRIHSDDPAEPDVSLAHWTRDLLGGRHPTTGPDDWTVVVDEAGGGRIVSTTVLISQTWAYDGIPVACGRMELVATDVAYRRRGLIREQFAALHARSAAKGELMQSITGIPWFYRQFGYEMAVCLGPSRAYAWDRAGNLVTVETETYRWRQATVADLPTLALLYEVHCRASMVTCLRNEAEWRYGMVGAHRESPASQDFRVVEVPDGTVVAYVELRVRGPAVVVRELGVLPGHPWRPVLAFLARALRAVADERNAANPPKRVQWLVYALGQEHPAYDALGEQLDAPGPAYAWYVRVADMPAFIWRVAPVLERRLAGSVMAGHTGSLRLDFYTRGLALAFENGRLASVEAVDAPVDGGDARFPDLTFLQLVFGHRTPGELGYARADCYARNVEARILLEVLFPKRPSSPVAPE